MKQLLFSFDGRINRRQFWIGQLLTLVGGLIGVPLLLTGNTGTVTIIDVS